MAAYSSESVENITRPVVFAFTAASIAQAISGLPAHSRMFLPGRPLLPLRARTNTVVFMLNPLKVRGKETPPHTSEKEMSSFVGRYYSPQIMYQNVLSSPKVDGLVTVK